MVLRYDSASLGNVERTPAGGLRAPATVARAGVLEYPWGREYVPASTLEASLSQLRGLPVTLDHPPERRVDSGNWSLRAAGHAGDDPSLDGESQEIHIYVQRADAVDAVERGTHRQLSMGYDVELDATPGETPTGERYDSVQIARTYNHIALVRQARGGSTLAVRLDAAGDAIIDDPADAGRRSGMKKTIRLDGVDHEVEASETTHQILAMALRRADEDLEAVKVRADAAEKERDTLKGERDQLAAKLTEATDPTRLDARVKARQDLEQKARAILGAETDFAGQADRQVMEAALRHDNAKADFAGETEDYVRGAFEIRARLATANRADGADRARVGAMIGQRQAPAPRRSPLVDAVRQLRQDQHEAATRPLGSGR